MARTESSLPPLATSPMACPVAGSVVGVMGRALGVGDGAGEQVEGRRVAGTALDVAVAHEALVDPAKLAGHESQACRTRECFVFHGG